MDYFNYEEFLLIDEFLGGVKGEKAVIEEGNCQFESFFIFIEGRIFQYSTDNQGLEAIQVGEFFLYLPQYSHTF